MECEATAAGNSSSSKHREEEGNQAEFSEESAWNEVELVKFDVLF